MRLCRARARRGFTLIELLIVVAIIAILAAIAVPNFIEAQSRAKTSRAKADMRSLATAIEAYAVDNNQYPVLRQDGVWGHGQKWCEYLFWNDTNSHFPGVPWLSTPIAYISDYPQQAFSVRKSQNQDHQGFQNFSYIFINFKGAYQDGNIGDTDTFLGHFELERGDGLRQIQSPMPINVIGGRNLGGASYEGIKAYSDWILFGIGPSGIIDLDSIANAPNVYGIGTAAVRMTFSRNSGEPGGNYIRYWRSGAWKAYDPTNGTQSLGFIYRLQNGTPGE